MEMLYDSSKVSEGVNSVVIDKILYEKLSNTIHIGENKKMKQLQNEIERVFYSPRFESESIKRMKGDEISGLVLNVTEKCNLRCTYCISSGNYKGERGFSSRNMALDTAKKAVDFFMPIAGDTAMISFYGGEPTNNMKLINETVKYIKAEYSEYKTLFSITSNFYDVEKYLSDIVDADMSVLISLDGPKNIHDKNRKSCNGQPSYERIMKNIEKLEEISTGYFKKKIGISITCADTEDIPEVVNFYRDDNKYTVARIGGLETKGLQIKQSQNKNGAALALEYLQNLSDGQTPPKVIGILFDQGVRVFAERSRVTMPKKLMLNGSCYPGKRKLFVDTDGLYYMCEKFGQRIPIGNIDEGINQNQIDNVIGKFTKIRNNICTNGCWGQRLCAPCIQTAKDPTGDISESGLAEHCGTSKIGIKSSLVLYALLSQNNPQKLATHLEDVRFV